MLRVKVKPVVLLFSSVASTIKPLSSIVTRVSNIENPYEACEGERFTSESVRLPVLNFLMNFMTFFPRPRALGKGMTQKYN